jgi:hypothetical protein
MLKMASSGSTSLNDENTNGSNRKGTTADGEKAQKIEGAGGQKEHQKME